MFWTRFVELCNEAGKSPNRVAAELGFSSSVCTVWKKGAVPRDTAIQKLAEYFHVPTNFLLGFPPFNNWEVIDANRKQFIDASDIDSKLLFAIWRIDSNSPETTSLVTFIKFVDQAIVSAEMNSDGVLEIKVKENFIGVTIGAQLKMGKKKPTLVSEDGLDAEQAELVRLYRNASPVLRAAALAVLKSAEGQNKAPDGVSKAE